MSSSTFATITDDLVVSLDTQVKNAIEVLTKAGVSLENPVQVPNQHNWRLGLDGLVFGDSRTPRAAGTVALCLYDPNFFLTKLIKDLAHMTHPEEVNRLLGRA